MAEFTWEYPNENHSDYLLRAGDRPVGSLQFAPQSTGQFEGVTWTFERVSIPHPAINVKVPGSREVFAHFLPGVAGQGVVTFAGGRRYRWTRVHPWSNEWCFRSDAGRSAVCVSQNAGALAGGAKVTVCSKESELPETPILILLAWHLRLLEFEHLSESIVLCG